MERSFYNEDFDFEELIKQKSDQHKIYPSDKVWKGIHNSLHPTRRWYWLGLVLFLGGISYYTVDQLSSSPAAGSIAKNNSSASATEEQSELRSEAVVLPFTPPNVARKNKVNRNTYKTKGLVVAMSEIASQEEPQSTIPLSVIAEAKMQEPLRRPSVIENNASLIEENINVADKEFVRASLSTGINKDVFSSLTLPTKDIAENLIDDKVTGNDVEIISSNSLSSDEKRVNWLQENAVYELSRPKLKRISWQVYGTPTMNYRKLMGNENATIASDSKNIPIALNIEGDVDNLVNHMPALGFEVGSMLMYAINKKVTFKTGVQFNFSRYNIQAYSSSTERATIALTNFYRPSTDSISSYTTLRNFGGKSEKALENKYYELSTPIGVDVLVIGKGRLQFSVGGTIQPTYLINRDNYLITTDYKNYMHQPSLVRRWNVNTSAEAFLSYKVSGFKFQLGPQFRYQLFSTYTDKYPIKEFLMEYGLKLGVSKAIR